MNKSIIPKFFQKFFFEYWGIIEMGGRVLWKTKNPRKGGGGL